MLTKLTFVMCFEQDYSYIYSKVLRRNSKIRVTATRRTQRKKIVLEFLKIKINIFMKRSLLKSAQFRSIRISATS